MQAQQSIAAIILAAGSSSRMGEGRHKLLLPLGGRPVLVHVLETALTSQARPLVLVLGHQAEQVRSILTPYLTQPALRIVENPAYRQGMSTSLHTGLRSLMEINDYSSEPGQRIDGAVVLLGDQPLMTGQVIDRLIAARQAGGKSIIAPLYHGKRGNPVLFAANLFPELLQVTGDEGGRSVMEHHREEVLPVEMGDTRPTYDVDTWEAYQQMLHQWQRQQL